MKLPLIFKSGIPTWTRAPVKMAFARSISYVDHLLQLYLKRRDDTVWIYLPLCQPNYVTIVQRQYRIIEQFNFTVSITVPSGICLLKRAADSAFSSFFSSGWRDLLDESSHLPIAVGAIAFAISWDVFIEKRLRMIQLTSASNPGCLPSDLLESSSNKIFAWLNGLPHLISLLEIERISSVSSFSTASRSFFMWIFRSFARHKTTDSTFSWFPKIIEPDCLIPSANSPWLAMIIPYHKAILYLNLNRFLSI